MGTKEERERDNQSICLLFGPGTNEDKERDKRDRISEVGGKRGQELQKRGQVKTIASILLPSLCYLLGIR